MCPALELIPVLSTIRFSTPRIPEISESPASALGIILRILSRPASQTPSSPALCNPGIAGSYKWRDLQDPSPGILSRTRRRLSPLGLLAGLDLGPTGCTDSAHAAGWGLASSLPRQDLPASGSIGESQGVAVTHFVRDNLACWATSGHRVG